MKTDTKADLRRHIDEARAIGASFLYYSAEMDFDEFENLVRDSLRGAPIEVVNGNEEMPSDRWDAIVAKIRGTEGGCLLVRVPAGSGLSKYAAAGSLYGAHHSQRQHHNHDCRLQASQPR